MLQLFIIGVSAAKAEDAESSGYVISLDSAIEMAVNNSVSSAVAENTKLSAYWDYRSYKADQLPEISFYGTLPSYQRSFTPYQNSDGTYSFVKSNNLAVSGGLQITQNIPFTGGQISVQTSISFLQEVDDKNTSEFMTTPISATLTQPIFGVNHLRWDRRIEPIRYEESKRNYKEDIVEITLSVLAKYFNTLLAKSQLEIAIEELKNSDELYNIAKARRGIGDISELDLSQLELQALQAKAIVTEAQSSYRAQLFELRAFLSISEECEIVIAQPESIPTGVLDYHTVLDCAMEHSAFAKSVIRRLLESEYGVATAKGNQRQIDLFASFGYSGVGSDFNQSYDQIVRNNVIELGVIIPILDWGKRKADVRMAESNQKVVEAQINEEKISFNQDIFLLVENFNNQHLQYQIALMAEKIASKNYNTSFQTFKSGDTDILTLNDARARRDAARQKSIEQIYIYWSYYYQIERLCLKDIESLLVLVEEK